MNKNYIFLLLLTLILFQNCQPLSSIQIETLTPAKIEFPGNFNKLVFLNLETDINNDNEIDTLLYNIITEEMNLGFLSSLQNSSNIDTSDFLYVRGFPDKEKLYKLDTISWFYLERLSGDINADIFIVLDSLKFSMEHDEFTEYNAYPVEYYKYREIAVKAYWSTFDLFTKTRLDKYEYTDTLMWDVLGYSKTEIENRIPSIERSVRETSYFTALDYAHRIFPAWKSETRYYFNTGNKDFRLAAQYAYQNKWKEASEIWINYTGKYDKEIASRACFNMAFGYEMMGDLDSAISWAEKSDKIKTKARTRNYISILNTRKHQLEKLKEQIN